MVVRAFVTGTGGLADRPAIPPFIGYAFGINAAPPLHMPRCRHQGSVMTPALRESA